MAAAPGNQYALGNNGGRPPVYESAEQLDAAINAYFEKMQETNGIITMSGLTYALGFSSRQSLYDYKEKEEFAYCIKKALLLVECGYEMKLNNPACTGAIFALKNMGWKDKTETEHSGELAIKQITGMVVV